MATASTGLKQIAIVGSLPQPYVNVLDNSEHTSKHYARLSDVSVFLRFRLYISLNACFMTISYRPPPIHMMASSFMAARQHSPPKSNCQFC